MYNYADLNEVPKGGTKCNNYRGQHMCQCTWFLCKRLKVINIFILKNNVLLQKKKKHKNWIIYIMDNDNGVVKGCLGSGWCEVLMNVLRLTEHGL